MGRGMAFPAGLRVLISTVLVLILVPPASSLKNNYHYCPPSSCGNIPNISYPFRLKGDPPNCGDQRFELSCDDHNHTLLSLHDGSIFNVSQINYNNYRIRIVDSGIQEDNYSFIHRYFLNSGNLNWSWPDWDISLDTEVVVIVNCEKPVTWTSSIYLNTPISSNCSNINKGYGSSSNSSFSQDSKRYLYLIVGRVNVMDVEESCTIEQMLTSLPGQIYAKPNISCTDIRNVFSYGFVLSWYRLYCGSCKSYDNCYLDDHNQPYCYGYPWVTFSRELVAHVAKYTGLEWLFEWHVAISVLGAPFVIAFFIYKWRRRHLSMYDNVEEFLQSQNNLMPIRTRMMMIFQMVYSKLLWKVKS